MNKLDELFERHPEMERLRGELERAMEAVAACFAGGGRLLLCGNGGSSADCEHIAGELMKGFLLKRPLTEEERRALEAAGDDGRLGRTLQRGLPCVVLTGLPALTSAFANDVDGTAALAQQAFAYAREGDALLAISTSGNAVNVCLAAVAVKARGGRVIALTGEGGGRLAGLADVALKVPARETFRVQELHLPLYHALCAALEERFFGGAEER
jgi:D-sedoheptulose 7-phosphate isomerase